MQAFDASGKFAFPVASGKLKGPRAIAADSNGAVFIADEVGAKVVVCGVDGHFIREFGSSGGSVGLTKRDLFHLSAVAVDGKGKVFVASWIRHSVQQLDRHGRFSNSFANGLEDESRSSGIFSLAVAGNELYAVYGDNNRVQVLDIEHGKFIRRFPDSSSPPAAQLNGPTGIAVDRAGNVLVCSKKDGAVKVFRRDGEFVCSFGKGVLDKAPAPSLPACICIDDDGCIYVGCVDRHVYAFGFAFA